MIDGEQPMRDYEDKQLMNESLFIVLYPVIGLFFVLVLLVTEGAPYLIARLNNRTYTWGGI